ncbi:hypothetical protein EI94DRAFT_1177686, partial [Lactarius quietus]
RIRALWRRAPHATRDRARPSPDCRFAFLSACHTAEVTEGSMMDEVLHLAAAVQYCGFRSVVGTMWAMVDEDGRDLQRIFTRRCSQIRDGMKGYLIMKVCESTPVCGEEATPEERITLERWVNFVHYGA